MNFKNTKILITGGTGFIGGRLAERLSIEFGADVSVLVHRWSSASWISRLPVELIHGDVRDQHAVRQAAQGCDYIFHCASGGSEYSEIMAINAEGTRNILDAVKHKEIKRVIIVSSVVVHGVDDSGQITEDTPYAAKTGRAYNDSKIAAEKIVTSYWKKYHVPVTIIRPTFVWGPRGSQFSIAPIRSMKRGHFSLINNGKAKCPAVFIDNLADAMLLAAQSPEAVGESFLVADGEDITWCDFFNAYADMLGIKRLKSIDTEKVWIRKAVLIGDILDRLMVRLSPNPAPFWRRAIRRSCRETREILNKLGIPAEWYLKLYSREGGVSIAKARMKLGYSPRIGLKEGMRITEIWLRDQFPTLMN